MSSVISAYNVFHAPNSCPPERRDKDGNLPKMELLFGGEVVANIPEGHSVVLEPDAANHAKWYFPWLDLEPVTAQYVRLGQQANPEKPHPCPFCGECFSDLGLMVAHVDEHAKAGVNVQPVAASNADLQAVDRMARQDGDRGRRDTALTQPPVLGGKR